ncbi:MAG: glycosyltransferase family 9 protein, partial [Ignavibacteriales bacterium]|nr:glycosyltransferase family 9 protein [Ignavibacteriales bacterium]
MSINSILIIKLWGTGDVMLSMPVVSNLRVRYPDARIDFLVEKRSAGIIRGNLWITNLIEFDKKKDSDISFIRRVRAGRYDMVLDLFSNPRTALATFLSGARLRVGYPFPGRSYAYNVKVTPRGDFVHNLEFNLDSLRRLNVPILDPFPHVPLTAADESGVETWFQENGLTGRTVVAVNPNCGRETERWSLENFAALSDRIANEYSAAILIVWGPGEESAVARMQELMKAPSLLIPKLSLIQLAALLKRCTYFVTNDSGPMHIGAAAGVPTLGIFGPVNPKLQGPYGERNRWVHHTALDCLGCNLLKCPIGIRCM